MATKMPTVYFVKYEEDDIGPWPAELALYNLRQLKASVKIIPHTKPPVSEFQDSHKDEDTAIRYLRKLYTKDWKMIIER